jgi:hypothetical protein
MGAVDAELARLVRQARNVTRTDLRSRVALAVKASPHVSWKRAARGGVIAVSTFVLLVVGYMILRAFGIGPAGSLLAAGKLSASDKVLVAAFDAPAADSSLGSTIAEAVRTNLSQSKAVHLVPTSAIVAALEQMKRPDTARIDFTTARELAQRTGAKAVVAGSVAPVGTGTACAPRVHRRGHQKDGGLPTRSSILH